VDETLILQLKVSQRELELTGWQYVDGLLRQEHDWIDHCQVDLGNVDVLVTRLQQLDSHGGAALHHPPHEKDVGLMGVSHLGIRRLNLLDHILAPLDGPIKSKAIELTKDVHLIVIAHHVEVLVVVDSELSVVGLDGQSGYIANFHLAS
jgi:hypothetical protein